LLFFNLISLIVVKKSKILQYQKSKRLRSKISTVNKIADSGAAVGEMK